jgi:hypothetical protein
VVGELATTADDDVVLDGGASDVNRVDHRRLPARSPCAAPRPGEPGRRRAGDRPHRGLHLHRPGARHPRRPLRPAGPGARRRRRHRAGHHIGRCQHRAARPHRRADPARPRAAQRPGHH